jgi:hypothetical protein
MSVFRKLKCFHLVLAKFYNNSNKYNEFSKVSVSTISRNLVIFERESLSINFPRERLKFGAFLGYGIFSMQPSLKVCLLETKR